MNQVDYNNNNPIYNNESTTIFGSSDIGYLSVDINDIDIQSFLSSILSSGSEEITPSDNHISIKRSHSPVTISLSYIDNSENWIESEPPLKKIKSFEERILTEYSNDKSIEVIKEPFEGDESLKSEEERVRIARTRKQRLYNGALIDAHNREQPLEFELVLERDPLTDNPLIDVHLLLVIHMKPHQIDGVKFLWDQVFESTFHIASSIDQRTQIDNGGSGAILAHCMGLGKTFTTITLLHTLFNYSKLTHIHRVLILCPLNTVFNWKNEFHGWLHDLQSTINVYLFNNDDIRSEGREEFLRHWHEGGGVLLMGYEMYRQLTYTIDDNPYDRSHKLKNPIKRIPSLIELANIERYRKYLRDPGPDLIICDEGHIIKNPKSAITCTLNRIRTRRRIILTGTPMQNNLKEYYAMVNFCRPNFLGSEVKFSYQYRLPIEAGQHRDSSSADVACMRRRIYALNRRLQNIIHRRGFDVLKAILPPKFEYAIKIRCQPLQRKLYETYIQYQNIDIVGTKLKMAQLFSDYQYLMKIWTHPWLLKPYFIEYYNKMLKRNEQSEMENIFEDEEDKDSNKQIQDLSPPCHILSSPTTNILNEQSSEETFSNAIQKQWWFNLFDIDKTQFDFALSGKIQILRLILDECQSIGDKLLVFSRSLIALDYIEECLQYWSQQSSSTLKWEKGRDYFRMDGKVPIKERAAHMKLFNDGDNNRSRLYLISTLAGGLGINLYSANRVIILDTSWNPAHDLQAMFRSYRLGQTKPVYIYRLIVKGTMEEKIYKRQITKQAMFHRVVDAKQLARHFTYDELAQLYQFDFDTANDPMDKTDSNRVQDKLLRNLLCQYKNTIDSYCEHDSFLIHHDEENLTVEEQIQATDEDNNPTARFRQESFHSQSLLDTTNFFQQIIDENSN